jgi:selenocysteine lyase/cysteine desulfurase
MLASQRELFEIPRDICYLNSASYSPLPLKTQEAGRAAVGRKGKPWTLDAGFANRQHDRARSAAARLINADPTDVALIPSISYGVATAAKLVTIPRGTRVLVLENDHSSPVLEWQTRAEAAGFAVETIRQPSDADWTSAVLAAIERPGAAPVALASISSVHWSDGGLIDLDEVAAALRRQGALFLIDATQGAGVMPLDVKQLDPDFVMFPTYKWLLGPFSTSQNAIRTARRWSRLRPAAAMCAPRTRCISPTPAMSAMPGVSTWASAIISSRWRWPRSAWK